MRRCLVDLDTATARKLWAHLCPHLPQPATDNECLTALHVARTAAQSVPFRARAYSHKWLSERQLPSQLPDHLKQSAERLYPRIVDAVGVGVKSRYPVIADAVRGAMEYVIEDCYANGDRDPLVVKPLMMKARERELRGLGLIRNSV